LTSRTSKRYGRQTQAAPGALQRTLQRFMRFYNCDRPHHGYRVRGRTPAALVFGARVVAR
jgi:hypothetical protein